MSVLNILVAPHLILSTPTQPVEKIDTAIQAIIKDMVDTMYADRGIGLAANQVGVSKQIIVMDVGENNSLSKEVVPISKKIYVFINPKIISTSSDVIAFDEGCLSIPGQTVEIKRPSEVTLEYLDELGQSHRQTFSGLQARCIQHEMDHLQGKLLVDYVSRLKKDMVLKKVQKFIKNSN